jgi:phage pi2 protein 07
MFNRRVVQTALKRTCELDHNPLLIPDNPADNQSSVISKLIYDIWGGEILKTHNKRGWHFYNRINGERIDFTKSEMDKFSQNYHFEDIPSNTEEIHNYFEQEQYSTFFMRFIREFEEAVGLESYKLLAS